MYAVIADQTICYLGSDSEKATKLLDSKKGASLANVHTLSELASVLAAAQTNAPNKTLNEGFSEAIERVFEVLDEAGINENSVDEVVGVLKQRSQTVVTEVRSLGIKGMKTVGEGFVALGDLLKKASEPDESDSTD